MNIDNKIIEKANDIFKNIIEENEKVYVKQIEPGLYCAFIETTRRGPGSAIIGEDLSYLYGASAFNIDELKEEYKSGKRSN